MRLGQLARKLALRPSQIIDYLSTKQIFPDEGSNAKLSDEITEQIILQFAPDRLKEILAVEEKAIEEPQPIQEQVAASEQELIIIEPSKEVSNVVLAEGEKTEVIKAPKVELTGLKVLGKIELKETRKKEVVEQAREEKKEQAHETRHERNKRNQGRENRKPQESNWKNPIQLKREKEAREAEEIRKKKLEFEKEKRTQNYLKRIKTSAPPKPVKIIEEHTHEVTESVIKEKPKGLIGRFLYWLNH